MSNFTLEVFNEIERTPIIFTREVEKVEDVEQEVTLEGGQKITVLTRTKKMVDEEYILLGEDTIKDVTVVRVFWENGDILGFRDFQYADLEKEIGSESATLAALKAGWITGE